MLFLAQFLFISSNIRKKKPHKHVKTQFSLEDYCKLKLLSFVKDTQHFYFKFFTKKIFLIYLQVFIDCHFLKIFV